jgi:hypothetical protein
MLLVPAVIAASVDRILLMTKARARTRAKAKAARGAVKRKEDDTANAGGKPGKFDQGSQTISKVGKSFDGGGFAVAGRGAGRGR